MLETLGGRIRETLPADKLGINRQRMIDEARRWFLESSDCDWWCEAAGYDPDKVRERARQISEGIVGLNLPDRRNRWTDAEISLLLAEKKKGTNYAKMSCKLGRHVGTIAMKVSELKRRGLIR